METLATYPHVVVRIGLLELQASWELSPSTTCRALRCRHEAWGLAADGHGRLLRRLWPHRTARMPRGVFPWSGLTPARSDRPGERLRMPAIVAPIDYDRWLANIEPDPRDLLVPFPTEPMTMWPISTRVNKPENDEPAILEVAAGS